MKTNGNRMAAMVLLLAVTASLWGQSTQGLSPEAPRDDQRTVTCADGTVLEDERTSPFEPNPCDVREAEQAPAPDVTEIDVEFLLAFGGPPRFEAFRGRENPSLAWRVARMKYEQDRRYFQGFVPEPPRYHVAARAYAAYGFGEVYFYRGRYGDFCRWPDAPGRPAQVNLWTCVHGPGPFIAQRQSELVLDGIYVSRLHEFVPGWVSRLNDELAPRPETSSGGGGLEGLHLRAPAGGECEWVYDADGLPVECVGPRARAADPERAPGGARGHGMPCPYEWASTTQQPPPCASDDDVRRLPYGRGSLRVIDPWDLVVTTLTSWSGGSTDQPSTDQRK